MFAVPRRHRGRAPGERARGPSARVSRSREASISYDRPRAGGREVAAAPTGPKMDQSHADVTMLLRAAASGERCDVDALMHAIYEDLRRLAMGHMRVERGDHTLQPTAIVHEAYLRLVDQRSTGWKDRLHFFSIASRIIRRILIDHARERRAAKRGGDGTRVSLADHDPSAPERSPDLVALDEALAELGELDERQARIVELRYFGGCTIDEVAELLGAGRRTIDRDWRAAKAWLLCRLEDAEGGGTGAP